MGTDKWINFIIAFSDKLSSKKYDVALKMGEDMLNNDLTPEMDSWLRKSLSIIESKNKALI